MEELLAQPGAPPPVWQERGTLCLPQLLQASEKVSREPFSGVNLLSLLPK